MERNGCCLFRKRKKKKKKKKTVAALLKKGIDNFFENKRRVPLKRDKYKYKVVSCTLDRTSASFGKNIGLMTRLAVDLSWLTKIHCKNHRIVVAVKGTLDKTTFNDFDTFYIGSFTLLENSRKIKEETKAAAQDLNIKRSTPPEYTGTHFPVPLHNFYTHLVALCSSIIVACENVIADKKARPDTKAKVRSYLIKLTSFCFLYLVCAYLDIVEIITSISKISESEASMLNEIKYFHPKLPTLLMTTLKESTMTRSHLGSFGIVECQLTSMFVKADDLKKQSLDKKCFDFMNLKTWHHWKMVS